MFACGTLYNVVPLVHFALICMVLLLRLLRMACHMVLCLHLACCLALLLMLTRSASYERNLEGFSSYAYVFVLLFLSVMVCST